MKQRVVLMCQFYTADLDEAGVLGNVIQSLSEAGIEFTLKVEEVAEGEESKRLSE